MNIQPVNSAYGSNYESKKTEYKSVPAQQSVKTEKVEISDQSSELQKVKAVLDEVPEIRLEVVKKIKMRIKSNDYPIENNLNQVLKEMIQNSIIAPY